MKVHTSEFKEKIKEFGRELDSKITYGTTELGKEELNSVTPHYESTILKSVMKQLDVDSNVEIPIETIINYQFGVKVGNGYEYLDYGNYVVYKVEKQEDTRSWKITCYDKMLYAMKPYESLGVSFPISIKDYLQAICTKLGLTLASGNFANEDKMIMNELYLDASGNGLDYTFRDVLDEIAQATGSTICINENDELEVRYPQNVGEYETTEGTDLLLENVDDGKDIDYELNGNTIQDGTPTPSSPQPMNVVSGRQDITISGSNLIGLDTQQYRVSLKAGDKITAKNTGSSSENIYLYTNYGDTTRNDYWTIGAGATRTITIAHDSNAIAWSTTPTGNAWVNKGDTLLEYEEYKVQNYEINLGKNLFDISTVDYASKCTLSNEVYTTDTLIQGNRNVVFGYQANNNYTVYPNETMYFSADIKLISGTCSGTNVFRFNTSGFTNTMIINPSFTEDYVKVLCSATNTSTAPIQAGKILFQPNNSGLSNAVFEIKNVMISKSNDTTYAPYKTPIELCKINDYKDMIFRSKGVNLFDKDTILTNKIINASGEIIDTNNYIVGDFIEVKPNTQYTISFTSTNTELLRIGYYKNDKTYIERPTSAENPWTITTPSNCYYIRVCTPSVYQNVMVNEGSTALPYEPYNLKGKWLLHKEIGKVVLDGSESIERVGMNISGVYRFSITAPTDIKKNGDQYAIANLLMSNKFDEISNYVSFRESVNGILVRANNTNNFIINCIETQTYSVAEFKTWLQNNNVLVYYVLATPTTTEITDTELINQLKAVELLEGMNNISITSGDLSTPLKLTYLSQMDTIDEEYLKDVNVNFGEKFGPVNSVVLSRAAESDSIYQKDDESVEQNGLTEVKIKDNQILNGNNRDEFLPSIFEKLNGLEYYLTDFSSTGVTYYDLLDKYKINVFDNSYKTIMLNNEVDITQGLEEQIYADRLEESETDYTKSDKTDRKINQAYIIVDKQNQQINSVVQSINTLQSVVNNQGEQVDALGTRLTQTVDNITASVTSIQTELDNGVSLVKTTSVIIDDNGLNVSTDNSKISTTMTNNSFEIKDSGDNVLAFFGYDETENISKSQMDNLTVTNYFVSGYHRTEKFERNGEKRTGHFYIG